VLFSVFSGRDMPMCRRIGAGIIELQQMRKWQLYDIVWSSYCKRTCSPA